MKKLIALFCIASVASVFAEGEPNVTTYVDSGNTFGVLRVDATNTVRTIVAVPWLEPSSGENDIHITNVIKTANLKTGDQVCYYDVSAGGFKVWQLNAQKKWEALKNVGDVSVSEAETLRSGNAFILLRENPDSCFYLYGQVPKNVSTVTIQSNASGVFNLIAPPTAKTFDLNSAEWKNVSWGDTITIELGAGKNVICKMRNADGEYAGDMKWRYQKEVEEKITFLGETTVMKRLVWELAPVVAVGQGFWYAAYGSVNPTVKWVKAND